MIKLIRNVTRQTFTVTLGEVRDLLDISGAWTLLSARRNPDTGGLICVMERVEQLDD